MNLSDVTGESRKVNTPEYNESELIVRARSGELHAFERLVAQHAERLWRCGLALAKDSHWAEDLAQETLIEAWRCISRFDGRCQFSTWLYGILRHRFLKGRRFQTASKRSDSERLGQVACNTSIPQKAAEASEDATRIRDAVGNLPEEHRLVVELRFFSGATLDEIAVLADCPLGTVKSRLHHGLEKLRKMNLDVNLFVSNGETK